MSDTPTDAEITRLADGSLPEDRAAAVRARVAADPELRERLREQERAVSLLRASEEIVAPAALHAALPHRRGTGGLGRRRRLAIAPLAAVAAAAVVAVVLLTGGGSRLTVSRTAGLALAAPTRAAPPVDRGDSDLLSLSVGSIRFPAYARRTSSRATGARTDVLDGRRVQTVSYDLDGRRIGYSIVQGAALAVPSGTSRTVDGVRYVITGAGAGARLITWRRAGHTCVIAARGVGDRTLLALAGAVQVA